MIGTVKKESNGEAPSQTGHSSIIAVRLSGDTATAVMTADLPFMAVCSRGISRPGECLHHPGINGPVSCRPRVNSRGEHATFCTNIAGGRSSRAIPKRESYVKRNFVGIA